MPRIHLALEKLHSLTTWNIYANLRTGFRLSAVNTHLTAHEKYTLYKLAKRKRGVLVEVGSYIGASSLCLAAGMPTHGAVLYCVDTWENNAMTEGARDTYQSFLANTKPLAHLIEPLRGTSGQIARSFDKSVDLLFIDADHSYDGVKTDVQSWFPKLGRHAIVVFHDIGWAEGVQRVVAELVRSRVQEETFLSNMYWAVLK